MTSIAETLHALQVLPARVRGVFTSLRSLRATDRAVGPLDRALIVFQQQLAESQRELAEVNAITAKHLQSVHSLATAVEQQGLIAAAQAEELARELQSVRDDLEVGDDATRQALVSALWAAHAPISAQPLVSVVMPTFLESRSGFLQTAVESVLAQSYQHLELLVVDNSRNDMLTPRPEWWPTDDRLRVVRSAPHQVNGARNLGIAEAKGSLIAYLDDDCAWFPWWLRSAVSALEGAPLAQFAYGVLLAGGAGEGPERIDAIRVTPLQLHIDNPIDTNSLVHRSDVGEEWNPDLASCGDYDLALRLADHPHVFVPVPACVYGTRSPDRIWAPDAMHQNAGDIEVVRANARRRRPLRVVAANSLYPLITETYIGDELEGLRRHGVEVVLARGQRGPTECTSAVDAPLFESLEEAISSTDPDLVLTHWATTAQWSGPLAATHGVPHAVRLHSFCAAVPDAAIYNEWCVGTWGFAHNPRQHPRAHELPTMILHPGEPNTDELGRSNTLLSVSAGLPKKAWNDLIAAAAEIDDARLHIIIGRTNGWEHLADEVDALASQHGHLGAVDVDLNFEATQRAIRSSAVLVYSSGPGVHLGQPRSIIEAALAATPLVVPDEPEMHAMVGETAAFYTRGSTASLVNAMRSALDQPHPIDDRLDLADRIRAVHAAPERFDQWANELTRAVVRWQSLRTPGRAAAAGRWWAQR